MSEHLEVKFVVLGTYMERCNALLILISCVVLAAVEKLLDARYFPKSCQLHDILLNR
jgi:hypothetical protein